MDIMAKTNNGNEREASTVILALRWVDKNVLFTLLHNVANLSLTFGETSAE